MAPHRTAFPQALRAPWVTWLLLLLALGLRIEHRYAYRNFFLDTEVQLAGAWQLMQGRGFCVPSVDPDDPCTTVYAPIRVFMPGYAHVVLPWLRLTRDPYQAVFALDVLSLCLLFGAIHGLFWRMTGQAHSLAARWGYVFLALSPAPLHYLTASGLWSLSLLAWAWWLLWPPPLQPAGKEAWLLARLRWLAALGLCVLAAWSRTAYLPLVLLPIGAWLWQRVGLRAWAWSDAGWLLPATGLGLWWLLHGSPVLEAHQNTQAQAWYPAHLRWIEPVALKTFVYYGAPHEAALGAWHPWLLAGGRTLAHLLSLALWLVALRGAWQARGDRSAMTFNGLWLLTAGAVLLLLGQQSLTNPPETWNAAGFWTYLAEPRYYAPLMLGLMLWLFVLATRGPQGRWRQGLRLWLMAVTLAAYTYPLWLKLRLHLGDDRRGTFLASPLPGWTHDTQTMADTAQLPLRVIYAGPSQAATMVGVPMLTPAAWDRLAQACQTPIYLLRWPSDSLGEKLPVEVQIHTNQ
jgi:hypothetical protein